MTNLTKYNESIFESIKHIDEYGNEYWLARELQQVLEYKEWRKFVNVINKAITACNNSNYNVFQCFVGFDKTSKMPNGGFKKIDDYKLSRYACYLIVQNSDPRKEVVALGQTYFAIQTRKQELFEKEYEELSEDEKRIYQRNLTKKGNYSLNRVAINSGVKNMAEFHNAGYKGLYNGEAANDIAKRKNLRYREDILDNMGEDELVANLFRINQTKQKLIKDNVTEESKAKDIHFIIGKNIREVIAKNGGTMPENLPTPQKSLKELEKKDNLLKNNDYNE